MGVIGPEYEFLVADVGMNGRMSDGGNWSRNEFQKEKNPPDENNPLSIPNPKPLPGRSKPIPYVCVGDDAFPLTSFMMKPYPQTGLTEVKRIFNYRLSRCRRISENGFGILANRWRIFRSLIPVAPEKATNLVLGRRPTPEKFTCIDRLNNVEFKSKKFPLIAPAVFLHSSIEIFNNSGLEITQRRH